MSTETTPRRVSFDWRETPLHWMPDEGAARVAAGAAGRRAVS